LRLEVCHIYWLAQTEDYADASELIDAEYAYFPSTSPPLIYRADRPPFPVDFSYELTDLQVAPDGCATIWGGAAKGMMLALLAELT
jgi:hypothetical protein